MNNRFKNKKQIIIILALFFVFSYLASNSVQAYVIESENYRLESDEIDMGAIGEMRDFSGLSQQEKELALAASQNPKQGPVVIFTSKISAWEIIFVSALVLLLLVFVYYAVFRKRLIFKK